MFVEPNAYDFGPDLADVVVEGIGGCRRLRRNDRRADHGEIAASGLARGGRPVRARFPRTMCGRFTLTHPNEAMAALFDALPSNDLPPVPRFNVCPTQPIRRGDSEGGRAADAADAVGLHPAWYKTPTDGPLIINARADTVATKPAFRGPCGAALPDPGRGFYEWRGTPKAELPWYFTRADGDPMALAGVWQHWERDGQASTPAPSCPPMRARHGRAAPPRGGEGRPRRLAAVAGRGGTRRGSADAAGARGEAPSRVDPRVNSNRASGPDLIRPIAA